MEKSKKALIVSPYLNHLGGGERYMLEAAVAINALGYSLTFAWDNAAQISELAKQFGLSIESVSLVPELKKLYFGGSPLAMWQATRGFDLILYMSDGSIPLLGGKNNILHMQVPYHGVGGRSLVNRLKLSQIKNIIVNSQFTKRVVDQEYGINSTVIYPPISFVKSSKKQKLILSVGRFEPSLNVKRQDVLIEAFRNLAPHLPTWRLVLAGASSSSNYLKELQNRATGLPIEFVTDGSFATIKKLYAKSRIYWHAAGYGVDEQKNPELCEHFGISVAEAVSASCIPLVVGKGGVAEIIPDKRYHWESVEELVSRTIRAKSGELEPVELPRTLTQTNFSSTIKKLC